MELHHALNELRNKIAVVISSLEVGTTIPIVCEKLGYSLLNLTVQSKYSYMQEVLKNASDDVIINSAKQILTSYPGKRGKPSSSDLQIIEDFLWWIEDGGKQRISNVTRYNIIESLEGISFWGRTDINEFLTSSLPITISSFSKIGVGDDGFLYESFFTFGDILSEGLFNSKSPKWTRIPMLEVFKKYGLIGWPDKRFITIIEKMVHPEVQLPTYQQLLIEKFNKILNRDNFELKQVSLLSGFPVYKVLKKDTGVSGSPKYIIFAAIGPKPDIVIDDAVNMDIRVVDNADKCLVYDQPPPSGDLTWNSLVEWWGKTQNRTLEDAEMRRNLGQRLRASLNAGPEQLFFDTYFKEFHPKFRSRLPALLPQVYLHYDPRNQMERKEKVLVRQRMDFLMLLRNSSRIVIEIDGKQHYTDEDGSPSPKKYAEMMTEDRRIKLLGYEVYRFGGSDFIDPISAVKMIISFFNDLFINFGVTP